MQGYNLDYTINLPYDEEETGTAWYANKGKLFAGLMAILDVPQATSFVFVVTPQKENLL